MDADKQAHWLDDELPQLHRVHQGPGMLSHLQGQHLPPCRELCMATSHPAAREVGVEQSFDVVYKGVLHIEPCWFQFKRELADIKEEVCPLSSSEAEFDEAVLLVALQVFGGEQETLHSGGLGWGSFLSLADQDSEVEIGLVVQLVVQLQVPKVDLHTEELEEGGGGLFPWEFTRHRVYMEENVVQSEPEEFS